MKKILLLLCSIGTTTLIAQQNQAPVVTNLSGSNNSSAKTFMLKYDLSDTENDPMTVAVYVSDSSNKNMTLVSSVSGEVGKNILSGINKSITIDYSKITLPNPVKFIIVADDEKVPAVKDIIAQVDCERMLNDLAFLAQKPRHRTQNAAHLAASRDTIASLLEQKLGNVSEATFTFGAATGKNIIGNHKGVIQAQQSYIIDAHYDTVSGAPGADDNGSGVVGVMEAARILSQYKFKKTLQFIAFDMEEDGLVGSKAYAKTLNTNDILGVLNFEMIGFYSEMKNAQAFPPGFNQLFPQAYNMVAQDTFKGNFITNVGNSNSNDLIAAFNAAAALYTPSLKVVPISVTGTGTIVPDLRRSDHAPFWDKGIKALMLTDGANFRNQNYHEASDKISTINKAFMCNVVKATIATAATLAELDHSGSASKTFELSVASKEANDNCEFSIVPNPASEVIYLNLPECLPLSKNSIIEIFDLNGKVLMQQTLNKGKDNYEIKTSSLRQGSYIVKINNISKKLIVR
jgi:hypothetical protein